MATGTLYTYPENFRAYKALIAAKYSGAAVSVASDFTFGETNKSEAFTSKFPLGKVPAFEDKNGVKLFEPNAIAYYLATEAMRGSSPVDAAYIQQWVEFADSEILPASCTWVFPCMGIMQYNKQATEKAKEDIKRAMSALNDHLLTRTFLVGERISLADIAVCCNLLQLYQWVMDSGFRAPYQNVNRWFTTLVNQKHFKAVIGDFKMCEKMAQFDAKKFAEMSGAGAKKEKQKKESAPKKETPKKKEEKKEQKQDDAPPAEPKKSKDPFAALPMGTFVMDDWKKMYSNNDTLTEAIPWFWKNFDKENYSIWRCVYKYPKELNMTFMTCNLVSGMFQRLDGLRKHGFGCMVVMGVNKDNAIEGVWVWRGQGLAFELSEDLQIDYESYEWTKMDPDAEDTKQAVIDYFAMENDFPKPYVEGKVFK